MSGHIWARPPRCQGGRAMLQGFHGWTSTNQGPTGSHNPKGLTESHNLEGPTGSHNPKGLTGSHNPKGLTESHNLEGSAGVHKPVPREGCDAKLRGLATSRVILHRCINPRKDCTSTVRLRLAVCVGHCACLRVSMLAGMRISVCLRISPRRRLSTRMSGDPRSGNRIRNRSVALEKGEMLANFLKRVVPSCRRSQCNSNREERKQKERIPHRRTIALAGRTNEVSSGNSRFVRRSRRMSTWNARRAQTLHKRAMCMCDVCRPKTGDSCLNKLTALCGGVSASSASDLKPLQNPGNLCFANATCQALLSLPRVQI